MGNRTDEIRDDEIRIIGKNGKRTGQGGRKWLWISLGAVAVVAVVLALVLSLSGRKRTNNEAEVVPELFDPVPVVEQPSESESGKKAWLGDYSDEVTPYTEHIQRTINDINLDIYIPHNARPSLLLGVPDPSDSRIIFANQAADVRADNGKINGAYVLAGKPLAWGLSKKGYVNPHNKEWTIENKIFRPVLFTILPFIGGLVSRVFDVSLDIIIFIINRLFCKSVKVPATFYLGKPAKAEDGTGNGISITKSLSYSLLLFGIGLVATLIYLLFAEFRV